VKEYGLSFPVSPQLMILQEVTLLKRSNRLKAARDLLYRAGYMPDVVPSRPSSLDSRLLALSAG
jgi:hypothetical protein